MQQPVMQQQQQQQGSAKSYDEPTIRCAYCACYSDFAYPWTNLLVDSEERIIRCLLYKVVN